MAYFSSPEWDKKFNNILDDIRRSQCVVLIGPEVLKMDGKVLRDSLRAHLNETNSEDITHYYERDGFYLFKDDTAKEDVQREVVTFYERNNKIDESILLSLVRLRTHLIISINPDDSLSEIAYKYGIKHRFAYFQHGKQAPVQDVELPTTEMPLYYNLFGSVQSDASLVLDYDDLFNLLESLFGTPGLPTNLKAALNPTNPIPNVKRAKHFLFVGFDFDKWYSQLLLKLLSEKPTRKFVIDSSEKNSNTTIFLIKQFGIEFIEDESSFLRELFRRAELQGLFRDIIETQSPDIVRITRFMQNGQVLEALETLRTRNEWQQMATILLAQYHELKKQADNSSIDSRDYWPQYNRITDAMLETIKTAS